MTGIRRTPTSENLVFQFVNMFSHPNKFWSIGIVECKDKFLDYLLSIAVYADNEGISPNSCPVNENIVTLSLAVNNSSYTHIPADKISASALHPIHKIPSAGL